MSERKSDKRINDILNALTLREKIALCSGLNEWDTKEIKTKKGKVIVPSVKLSDGPHGLRKTVGQGDNLGLDASEPATCFPSESLLSCSFDRELAFMMGKSIAKEAKAAGVCTVLGPGANIKRNPLCGRNFEYLSEDPYISGRMAAAYIKGAQSQGIGTSLKHFACNSQEYFRMTSDSKMDERTLREIYLPAFEYATKTAKPATVMAAYNMLNGISCTDNVCLLDTILRKEWGYKGLVVSDWGAINDRISAFRAGCDLIMPGGSGYGESDVEKAVKSGKLKEEYINRSAKRVIRFALRQNALLKRNTGKDRTESKDEDLNSLHESSHRLARKIAEESAVLLKNDDGILPLKNSSSLCLIGAMAEDFRIQGSGSSKINPVNKEDFRTELKKAFPESDIPYEPGYSIHKNPAASDLMKKAAALAKTKDQVIIIAGLPDQYEAEGMDRRSMKLPDEQNRLIEEIAKVNPNTIVVLINGCVVETPWADRVKGILWMGLSGEAGPSALCRLLTGAANPCGRLTESWPLSYRDCKSADTYLKQRDALYTEGIFVGYRYYDREKLPVRFSFGHGLSYTSFTYRNLQIKENKNPDKLHTITVDLTNTGDRAGAEAVLLWIHMPQDGIKRPIRELKGFEKVYLEAGETKTISFTTDERSFALWEDGWKVYEGTYQVEVGSCLESFHVKGERLPQDHRVKQTDLSAASVKEKPYTVNSTIKEISGDVLLLRILYHWFENKQAKTFGRESAQYLSAMCSVDECPLRAVQNFTGLKHHFALAMADFGNRHYLKGILHLIK